MLIKKSENAGLLSATPMSPLSLLDDSMVKNNSCPICHTTYHLIRDKGFKICPYCYNTFKIWNGKSYLIHENNTDLSVNEMILKYIGLNKYIKREEK